jgi:hypothetical protein
MTVDHLDHKKAHNCPSNLVLLDIEIHNYISWRSWLNAEKLGPPPSKNFILTDDDFDPKEAGIGRRYTEEEIQEVPF